MTHQLDSKNTGKKLFKVKYVNQSSGEDVEGYFLADGLEKLDENIADILEIYPIPYEELS